MKKSLLTLILILFGYCVSAQNLLVNPGFETWVSARPTGWTVSNAVNISQNTTNFTEGTKSCMSDIQSTNITFNISQNIAVTAGKTYTFRVSYLIERGDGTDARILCNFRTAALKAIPMSLYDSLALKGPGGNSAYFPTELGIWKTYTCDVVAPVGAASFVFSVRNGAYSIVSWDNFYFGVNTLPTVTVSKSELLGFNYTPGNGPSTEQSLVVKGSNLTSSITLTAPANYEISTQTGVLFNPQTTITLPPTNGIVNSTTIYTRLTSNLSANTYNGNMSVSATGISPINVSVTGSVSAPPVLINTNVTSITSINYNEGFGPSGIKSFTVSGSGLLNGITITAPNNYEISILGGTNFMATNAFTISQSGGSIATTTVYVRLKAGLSANSYIGNISLSTNGATKSIALTGSVYATPEITASVSALSGFRYAPGNGPSTEQTFTVSGKGLTNVLIISAPTNYEISTETGLNFSGTSQLIFSQSGGLISSTPIYIRLKASLTAGTYTGNLTLMSSGATTKTISLTGLVADPIELNVSTDAISGFSYTIGTGPSSEKLFTFSAKGLSSILIITASTNYEISTDSGVNFSSNNQLIIPLSLGSVALTTVYVRLKSGLNESNSYSGNIVLSSGVDITKNIALSGYVSGLPEITLSTFSFENLNYVVGGGPSMLQSFTVSAKGLSSDLIIKAPANFELSTLDGAQFTGKNSLTLLHTTGNIATTLIYLRMVSGLGVATYTGNIELSSVPLTSKFISLTGNVLLSTNVSNPTNEIKVYSNSQKIRIQGVAENQTIELYTYAGVLLQSIKSTQESFEISLKKGAVYFVKIGTKVYKCIL